MSETTETKPETKETDYLSRAAGSFGLMGGVHPDTAKRMVLDRVGVPQDDPLRAGLKDVHPSDTADEDRLPDTFPPAEVDGPLVTAGDYLGLIDAAMERRRVEARAQAAQALAPVTAPEAMTAPEPLPVPEAAPGLGASAATKDVNEAHAATDQADAATGGY